jgi:glycosyltransferase involved in cell wall biosynthesis
VRVLQIHNAYRQSGGEDQVVEDERRLLVANGHHVRQLLASNDRIRRPFDAAIAALRAPYSWDAKRWTARELATERPDIVHVHNTFPLLSPAVYDACIDARIPVVQTLHNYRPICPGALLMRDGVACDLCVHGSVGHSIRYGCYRGSRLATVPVAALVAGHRRRGTWKTRVDRFIALTNFAKRKFATAGFPLDRMSVKPNFCGTVPVEEGHEAREGAIYVGRLSREKGLMTLLDSWADLPISLTVIGDGPLASSLAPFRSISNVRFLGPQPKAAVIRHMRRAKFLVLPSECYEGFPLVLAEAFACGLPVLGSRIGSVEEIIDHGVTGLLFETGSVVDLRDKALWLATRDDERREMARNARSTYLSHYTPEVNYSQLAEIYRLAATSRARV